MKKTIICLLLAGAVFTYYGCKKDPEKVGKKTVTSNGDPTALIVITDISYVDPQLREMAKGFAWWGYHNDGKKKKIHDFIAPNDNFRESTGFIWNHFLSFAPPFDLEDKINDACINHNLSLIYDRSFF